MTEEKNVIVREKLANKMEIHKCVLCHNAPCKKMYKNIDPERIIRAVKFKNEKGARNLIGNEEICFEKNARS